MQNVNPENNEHMISEYIRKRFPVMRKRKTALDWTNNLIAAAVQTLNTSTLHIGTNRVAIVIDRI